MAGGAVDFSLYLITDRHVVPAGRSLPSQVEAALAGGVKAVQLREKELTVAARLPLARELRELTRRYGAKLLINDRIDLALAVDADGVHLGGHSLPTGIARQLLGPDKLIGVSTHSPEEIAAVAAAGADFVTFGPVFDTPSKRDLGRPTGIKILMSAAEASPVPLFALGGIAAANLAEVLNCGVRRIACISAVLGADDPAAATRQILQTLS